MVLILWCSSGADQREVSSLRAPRSKKEHGLELPRGRVTFLIPPLWSSRGARAFVRTVVCGKFVSKLFKVECHAFERVERTVIARASIEVAHARRKGQRFWSIIDEGLRESIKSWCSNEFEPCESVHSALAFLANHFVAACAQFIDPVIARLSLRTADTGSFPWSGK